MKTAYLVLSLTAAALMAAPSAMSFDGSDPASGGDPRLGEEVSQICFSSSINRWSEVKGEDGVILLDRTANDWYRLEISEGCSEKLIRRANHINIETKPGTGCLRVNDSISLVDYGGLELPCRIKRINKWNAKGSPPDIGEPLGEDEED